MARQSALQVVLYSAYKPLKTMDEVRAKAAEILLALGSPGGVECVEIEEGSTWNAYLAFPGRNKTVDFSVVGPVLEPERVTFLARQAAVNLAHHMARGGDCDVPYLDRIVAGPCHEARHRHADTFEGRMVQWKAYAEAQVEENAAMHLYAVAAVQIERRASVPCPRLPGMEGLPVVPEQGKIRQRERQIPIVA